MTTIAAAPCNVIVSAERLAELEAIETKYKVDQEKKKERLKALVEQQTPDSLKKRVMKHYELHKDNINAKRREKRRLVREAKEAAEKSKTPGVSLTESVKLQK
jgi:sulfite reductase beta subunit-like hemoprotein